MKKIRELRRVLDFHPQEINSSIVHFATKARIDFNVFLPTKGINLQRDFVWTIEQKRELIWSIFIGRQIPRMAMINTVQDEKDIEGTYQVIDGKQRLSAMLGFYRGEFDIIVEGKNYFMYDLPDDYQAVFRSYMFPYYIVNEYTPNTITDQQKIDWFKYINFQGTPQDVEHFKRLS